MAGRVMWMRQVRPTRLRCPALWCSGHSVRAPHQHHKAAVPSPRPAAACHSAHPRPRTSAPAPSRLPERLGWGHTHSVHHRSCAAGRAGWAHRRGRRQGCSTSPGGGCARPLGQLTWACCRGSRGAGSAGAHPPKQAGPHPVVVGAAGPAGSEDEAAPVACRPERQAGGGGRWDWLGVAAA